MLLVSVFRRGLSGPVAIIANCCSLFTSVVGLLSSTDGHVVVVGLLTRETAGDKVRGIGLHFPQLPSVLFVFVSAESQVISATKGK